MASPCERWSHGDDPPMDHFGWFWTTSLDSFKYIRYDFLDCNVLQAVLWIQGMTVWHMLREHGANYRLYEKKLSELGPLLGQLANVSQVIWLQQYPSVDFYGDIGRSNTAVVLEKIDGYNKITRRILEWVIKSKKISVNIILNSIII